MKRPVKQFRAILVQALKEFLDGGEPFGISQITNGNGFFYTNQDGETFMVLISHILKVRRTKKGSKK
jgi:hypothetical protein